MWGTKNMLMQFVGKVFGRPRWRCEENFKDIWKIDYGGGR
jgi:hypothetical protein